MAKDICVLAYSGGLDTSVCVRWLMDEMGLDVVCVVGEVGQEHEGLEQIKQPLSGFRFRAERAGHINRLVILHLAADQPVRENRALQRVFDRLLRRGKQPCGLIDEHLARQVRMPARRRRFRQHEK